MNYVRLKICMRCSTSEPLTPQSCTQCLRGVAAPEARLVAAHRLEGVEGGDGGVPAGEPVRGRVAVVLLEQEVVEVALHVQHLEQALVYEHVLAPAAVPRARLHEVLLAPRHARPPRLHRLPGEDLERPVQAALAVVQVHPGWPLLVAEQGGPQPVREEDAVRVDLHR
eukprot:CAMPEP_0179217006 /NCGR_PEP_ID=MMETSP0797-20121207/3686_1 /TAXON_ID=47934 /ORGANISM="Dinophysis acuminata, Strain DAEP01" /LENGTH=167 /DNA_ID=CAMNT_0020923211 /DNA_START=238 /DNA_END=738 /DNA_ORIENTATION=-